MAWPKSTKRSSTAKRHGCRRRRSLSGHERLRCLRRKKTRRFDCGGSAKSASGLCPRLWPSFAHPLRALAPSPPLLPRFSQCGRADQSPASSSQGCYFTTFCHQKLAPKVSARHLRRDRTPVLTERARKTSLFAAQKDAPLRLWRLGKVRKRPLPSPVAVVCTPAPGARTAVRSVSACGALRMLRCAARNDDFSCCYLFSAGRRPACFRDVKMSDEEAAAHRALGTIVRNSVVFRDRSARCAAVSRPFSPRGLLWLFLRKKERRRSGSKPAKKTDSDTRQGLAYLRDCAILFSCISRQASAGKKGGSDRMSKPPAADLRDDGPDGRSARKQAFS